MFELIKTCRSIFNNDWGLKPREIVNFESRAIHCLKLSMIVISGFRPTFHSPRTLERAQAKALICQLMEVGHDHRTLSLF